MAKLTSFEGLGVVVTGASSGIGEVLSRRLAGMGARVVLVARRREELDRVAGTIRRDGGEAHVVPCDVADREQAFAAAKRAEELAGPIDVLVNNAGYGHHRFFLDWDVEDMERMMRVNYFGTLYFTKALLPAMVERRRGWIVFLSSVAGKIAPPEESAYAASKFAVTGLAEALSIEVEDEGVHVLTVYPGVIRTPFFDEEALARMPPVSKRSMVEPEALVDATIDALAKGRHELTYPRSIALAYPVRGIAPSFMRRQIRRTTIDAVGGRGAVKSSPPTGERR